MEEARKNSRLVTVFNGLIINLSMNKKFSGKTLVKQDKVLLEIGFQKSPQTRKCKIRRSAL